MTTQERAARGDRVSRDSGESDERRRRHARNNIDDDRAQGDERDGRESRAKQRRSRLSAEKAAERGVRYISRFTGKEPETVTQIARSDSGWLVGVEVVEDRRIPSSSDILAVYEVEIDRDGEVDGYRRRARYSRGRGNSEGQ